MLVQGCLLGQYQQLPELHNGSACYKQLNSYELSFGFLYRGRDGCWVVGNELGSSRKLKCEVRRPPSVLMLAVQSTVLVPEQSRELRSASVRVGMLERSDLAPGPSPLSQTRPAPALSGTETQPPALWALSGTAIFYSDKVGLPRNPVTVVAGLPPPPITA